MKVLHALETFLPISENWIYPQVTQVRGVEPAVMCAERKNADIFPANDFPIFQNPPPWNRACGLPRLANSLAFRLGIPDFSIAPQVRKWRPALIHAHFGMRGYDVLSLKKKLLVPLVVSFYGLDAWLLPHGSAMWRERFRELFERGDFFLAEGPAMRARLKDLGCPHEKSRVVRIGADVANIPFQERAFEPPFHAVMIARFVEKKGLADGLRACGLAIKNGVNLRATVIGESTDASGEQIKAELHEIARTPALEGRVTFTGFLNPQQAQKVMTRCHFFLAPSKHAANGDAEGGSPVSLTEALASGLFCIATRHCDIPEVIVDGVTGYLCESGDVPGFAAAITKAAANANSLPTLCLSGRARIESDFSVTQQVRELGEVYAELAGSRAAESAPR